MSETYDSTWRRWRFTPWRDILRGRITGRLDRKRIIAQSGLPAPAVECIHRVVKRTRLWRLEKAQVAQELIAHFADGLEAEHTIDELIESFGDTKQAARLIRRAKIRQRPLPWHIMRWTRRALAIGTGVFVVLYGILAAMYFMQSPRVTTDYLPVLNRVASSLEDEERAWPLYAQALLGLGVDQFRDEIEKASHPGDGHWDDLVAYIQAHHADIELIRKASRRPGFGYVLDFQWDEWMHRLQPEVAEQMRAREQNETLYSLPIPAVGLLRQIARLLAADAHLAALNGQPDRAYDNIVAMFAIAEHVRESPTLINGLVCVRIHTLAYRLVSELLQEYPEVLTNEQLRDLAHRIGRIDGRNLITFEGERATFYDFVQRYYSDDGHGDGYLTSAGFRFFQHMPTAGWVRHDGAGDFAGYLRLAAQPGASRFTMASRSEIVAMYDRMVDAIERHYHTPLRVQPALPADVTMANWSEFDRHYYMPLTVVLPAVGSIRIDIERYGATQDVTLIGIALELYRREHNRWPDALNELAPKYMRELPVDRISGGPLCYRVVDDQPTIYSVGVDLDDDGGRMVHIGGDKPSQRTAERRNERAAQWLTPEQRETQTPPDGDWLLWPIPSE